MRNPEAELKALSSYWADAELVGEGERRFALLPNFKVVADGKTKVVSALLQPWPNGYTTRLYFSERFTTKGANWDVYNILGRSWYACSWNNVPADLPWVEIIACHLQPLQ
jgi:hypothetical protein